MCVCVCVGVRLVRVLWTWQWCLQFFRATYYIHLALISSLLLLPLSCPPPPPLYLALIYPPFSSSPPPPQHRTITEQLYHHTVSSFLNRVHGFRSFEEHVRGQGPALISLEKTYSGIVLSVCRRGTPKSTSLVVP